MNPPSPRPSRRIVAIVLAAGLGTRMKSRLPKVLHPLCGKPMLAHVLDTALAATGERPLVVYSPQTEAIRDVFAVQADFALQSQTNGTGDALRAALDVLPEDVDEILVLSGDVPLVEPELLRDLLDQRRLDHAAMALTAVAAYDPRDLGRVVRNEAGTVERVVEAKDAAPEELEIAEINAGLYAFDVDWLRGRIASLTPSPSTGELYLTELIGLARADGRLVAALDVEDDGRLLGINDRAELAQAEWDMRAQLNAAHMRAGVTMRDPSTVYLEAGVRLAPDVTLEPNVILRGSTSVAEGTVIGAGSQIIDSVIGARCHVWSSVVEGSEIGDDVSVGPFAHLRAGSVVGNGSEIGNFAEIKNSRLGARVKQHHNSYLGDADVGAGTNVGAGTITANYDGRTKFRTAIGQDVFLGVDTMLRAPIDVPAGKLAVGVPARIREPREPGPPARDQAPSEPPEPGETEA